MSHSASITLEDILAFNALLASMSKAGVPVYLRGLTGDGARSLDRINVAVAQRIGSGDTLEAILESCQSLGSEYVETLHAWVASGRDANAIEPLVRMGQWENQVTTEFGFSLFDMWIVWVLASSSLLFMVWNLTPKLEGMYAASGLVPGPAFRALAFVHSTIWIGWIVCGAITIGSLLLWRWMGSRVGLSCVPFRSKILQWLRQSAVAGWMRQSRGPETEIVPRVDSEDVSGVLSGPMARWGLERFGLGRERGQSMALVAEFYRDQSVGKSMLGLEWMPVTMGTLLGGAVVLGLGLSLFAPMVELLYAVCTQ
jgi:hypothetical protein